MLKYPGFKDETLMDKEERKEFKAFEKALIAYPYWDGEELSEEHKYIFEWMWKRNAEIREKAWMYDSLNK